MEAKLIHSQDQTGVTNKIQKKKILKNSHGVHTDKNTNWDKFLSKPHELRVFNTSLEKRGQNPHVLLAMLYVHNDAYNIHTNK